MITLISTFIISLNQQNQLYDQFNFIERQSLIHYYTRLGKNHAITNAYLIDKNSLELLEVRFTQDCDCLQIIQSNSVLLTLKQSDERQIVIIGTLIQIDDLLVKYPATQFKYYLRYNNLNPNKIIINNWNRGRRVSFPEFYPQGDDGGLLKFGTALFTKDTDDAVSKGLFYHRYYDFQSKLIGGNGNSNNVAVLAKRR
ncbi:hypothetical protein pb186bvf_007233 [Paramecium bursaria]